MKELGHLKGDLIEKVIYDKSGRLVRATFCVYERDGRIKAKLLKFSYIDQLEGESGLALSVGYKKELIETFLSQYKSTPTPYFKNILSFTGSKPRAPTFA